MGETAELTGVQNHQHAPHKVTAEQPGCFQSAVSKRVHRKLAERENCGRRRCTDNWGDYGLKEIIK